jgi:hypothetical protein
MTPGVRGRARAYRSSASTASRLRFLSDLRSFFDLRLCLRSFLRLRSFRSREVELLDESESLLESEEERPIVDVMMSRGRCWTRRSYRSEGVARRGGRPSLGGHRARGCEKRLDEAFEPPGGGSRRARVRVRRRVERRSQVARARAIIGFITLRPNTGSHKLARASAGAPVSRARDRPTMRRRARRGLVLALVFATFVLLPRPAEGARPLVDPRPPSRSPVGTLRA